MSTHICTLIYSKTVQLFYNLHEEVPQFVDVPRCYQRQLDAALLKLLSHLVEVQPSQRALLGGHGRVGWGVGDEEAELVGVGVGAVLRVGLCEVLVKSKKNLQIITL